MYEDWARDRLTRFARSRNLAPNKVHFGEGLVFRPEDYMYSSAADYAGEKGLLNDIVIK